MVPIHVFEISVVKNLEKVNSSILARVVHFILVHSKALMTDTT